MWFMYIRNFFNMNVIISVVGGVYRPVHRSVYEEGLAHVFLERSASPSMLSH